MQQNLLGDAMGEGGKGKGAVDRGGGPISISIIIIIKGAVGRGGGPSGETGSRG